MSTVDWSALPPPQPDPDLDSAGFWTATASGELRMCRCGTCGLWHQPPLERCRRCAAPTMFEPVAGTGTIYTFVVQRQAAVVGCTDVPYVVALVDLDEQPGLRLPGRIIGIDPDDVSVGMAVRARIVALAGGHYKMPVFETAHRDDRRGQPPSPR